MSTWEPTPQEQASLVVWIRQHDLSRPAWFDRLPLDTIIANTNGIGGDGTPGVIREALSIFSSCSREMRLLEFTSEIIFLKRSIFSEEMAASMVKI